MQRQVPLGAPDLPDFAEVEAELRAVLAQDRIPGSGRFVAELEQQACRYTGAAAVATSSGTTGLLFALQALGLGRGGKVILPSFTSPASAQAILYAGGRPLFADIGEDLTLDAMDLAALLDQHRDAAMVMPVHMYGLPCDAEAIERVVLSYGGRERPIRIVYDAAHAFGAAREGQRVGGLGNAEVFSLSGASPLAGAEGGLVTSQDEVLVERIRHMRAYGLESNGEALYPGLNGRLSEIHAVLALASLKRLDERLELRGGKAREYAARISERTDFRVLRCPPSVRHTFRSFAVLIPDALAARREQLRARLRELGVETGTQFSPPVHEQRYFRRFADRPLPRTESLARRVLTLPFFTRMHDDDMDFVADALRRVRQEIG